MYRGLLCIGPLVWTYCLVIDKRLHMELHNLTTNEPKAGRSKAVSLTHTFKAIS